MRAYVAEFSDYKEMLFQLTSNGPIKGNAGFANLSEKGSGIRCSSQIPQLFSWMSWAAHRKALDNGVSSVKSMDFSDTN
jgi:hypothetical protein